MNEINPSTPTPTPAMQPISMHGPTHSHGSLHLIVGLLGVLLVLETIVFGYVVMQYVDLQNEQEALIRQRADIAADKVDDEKIATVPPFVYVKDGKEIVVVNHVTGKETVVHSVAADFPNTLRLFAVPQVGFDGRIFFLVLGEGDSPGLGLQQLDLNDRDSGSSFPAFVPDLPFTSKLATALSPDQVYLAAAYYNPGFEEESRELVVWNMLTGEKEVIGTIAEGEAFSSETQSFAGSSGFNLNWINRNCVTTSVFTLSESGNNNPFLETREFCRE